jgi:hypothetical protein
MSFLLAIEIPGLCMDRPDAIIKTVLVLSHIANQTLEHHVGADQVGLPVPCLSPCNWRVR